MPCNGAQVGCTLATLLHQCICALLCAVYLKVQEENRSVRRLKISPLAAIFAHFTPKATQPIQS